MNNHWKTEVIMAVNEVSADKTIRFITGDFDVLPSCYHFTIILIKHEPLSVE